ncbi:hypothetical protein PHAVU_011G015400 [Phaseolus vulgaris]|uniref:Uncharacterized protein n=1 Tax=Phaseolus vulgaris TaxID=3885 RepID=V7ADY3_PHAVU|nr:hypothetical protein PHAVU_011G015400g [Phaseolus vulgaris]ESW03455.1 hypothetical protein PHAVU_011G015400g [Phaseolus vulgaris]
MRECEEYLGDVLYGDDDLVEMKDFMYREDVVESMRRERESKELKNREKRRRSSCCTECFCFLTLLRAFFNF